MSTMTLIQESSAFMIDYFKDLDSKTLFVLGEIYKRGPVTKKEIQMMMNIKLTTLNRIMKVLEERKLIVPSGAAESTGGRKAITYDINHQDFYLIGIDLSRTYVKIILTNLKLSVLSYHLFRLDEWYSADKTLDEIISVINQLLKENVIQEDQILGIGIGTIGPLDRERGVMLNPKGFLNQNWRNVPLKTRIENRLSIRCFIDNGANNAALLEYRFGIGKGRRSVAYIHCGIGIRSAVIKDGILIRSMNDQEDAFSHMIVQMGDTDGNSTIESFSTLDAMIRLINKRLNLTKDELSEANYKEILETSLRKNDAVHNIIRNGAEIFGLGLSNFARLLNPDIIILSGPLIMNLDNYYQTCINAFHDNYHIAEKTHFSKGGLFQEDTIAIGSAAMVFESYLRDSGKY